MHQTRNRKSLRWFTRSLPWTFGAPTISAFWPSCQKPLRACWGSAIAWEIITVVPELRLQLVLFLTYCPSRIYSKQPRLSSCPLRIYQFQKKTVWAHLPLHLCSWGDFWCLNYGKPLDLTYWSLSHLDSSAGEFVRAESWSWMLLLHHQTSLVAWTRSWGTSWAWKRMSPWWKISCWTLRRISWAIGS